MIDIADKFPIMLVIAIYIAYVIIALLYKDQLSLALRTLMEDGHAERDGGDRHGGRDAGRSPPASMDDYRFVLGRVGFVLIVLGTLAIAHAVYSMGSLMDNYQNSLGHQVVMAVGL